MISSISTRRTPGIARTLEQESGDPGDFGLTFDSTTAIIPSLADGRSVRLRCLCDQSGRSEDPVSFIDNLTNIINSYDDDDLVIVIGRGLSRNSVS